LKGYTVEFGKYLGKGIWGLADKGLQVVYGIGYVVLVIRELPREEFGNFVLLQEIFLIISALATAVALQPLVKYAAEERDDHRAIVTGSLVLNVAFVLVASIAGLAFRGPLGSILNAGSLTTLLLYLPALLLASFVRNFTLILLQTRFLIKEIFWTDVVHFLGAPLLVLAFTWTGTFHTAVDLITVNLISLSLSSILGFWFSRSLFRVTLGVTRQDVLLLWDYGKYSLGGIASYLIYSKADTFILSAVAGPVQVAIYNSVKVFIRIYDMISQLIQMFILPATSRLSSKGETASLKAVVEKAITFSTIGMLPVFLLFLFCASILVGILYGGRYQEAVPLLQVFSALTFFVPAAAVATNTLMGLGHARLSFILSIQFVVASVVLYAVCIPLFGTMGAAIAYVGSTVVLAWLSMAKMNRFVPVTIPALVRRTDDITVFIRSRIMQKL
jgi:O-antigen/teichoic acid export membrane protein